MKQRQLKQHGSNTRAPSKGNMEEKGLFVAAIRYAAAHLLVFPCPFVTATAA